MFGDTELLADLIQTTADLIAEDPIEITLKRKGYTRTPSGGQVLSETPVDQDPVKRFFAGVTGDAVYTTSFNGEMVECRHVIIGMPGDDIQEKDLFTVDGRDFQVVEIHPEVSFQRKGWVIERV